MRNKKYFFNIVLYTFNVLLNFHTNKINNCFLGNSILLIVRVCMKVPICVYEDFVHDSTTY